MITRVVRILAPTELNGVTTDFSIFAKLQTAFRGVAACAMALCLLPAGAETVRLGGTGSAIGSLKRLAQAYQAVDPEFRLDVVPNLGSSGGIRAVQNGTIVLGASSRPLKAEETAAGLQAFEYGRSAFVVITSKPGVGNISRQTLAELLAGRQTHWADGQVARVVLRPSNDMDSGLLASLSPEVKTALEAAYRRDGMVISLTDQEAVDAVERLPGGIGTSTMALLISEQRTARAVTIDGVEPSPENIVGGRYPLSKTMYLVHKGTTSGAAARFLDFIRSPAGRRVLAQSGHFFDPAAPQRTAANGPLGR